ncbi:hypothetical protein SCHIN_v1c05570 [Spiroplasma chinense]|uniref:Lipolytic enzyme, GDSL family n=1 Tax=Spiroplasma chinense TaxID=216932 RepID=A0A5B9Y3V9_9MOLU|nr:SGNH/GDSL hydrolase family protein [Spiroplasma chinense]QEH61754.1 hypothetical protein SCHIN_v1c05570 [Spiroplasma chinense]
MRKLLGFLGALSLTATSTITVVACTPTQGKINTNFDLSIGIHIDKSKAQDTSSDKNEHLGVSNFFTLGDSLSDQNGITTLLKNKLGVNLQMAGEYKNGFSNGPTTAAIINEKLKFTTEEFSAANIVQEDAPISKGDKNVWGKNYSVGGATAMTQTGVAGMIINDSRIDLQAEALVKQQVIHDDDMVLFEIGGNDLFALIDNAINDPSMQVSILNEAMANIKNSIFTLLNNGVKKLAILTPPNLEFVPKYNETTDEDKMEFIQRIGKEFNEKMLNVINEAKQYYENNIYVYGLYENFESILDGFKEEVGTGANITDKSTTPVGSWESDLIQGKSEIKMEVQAIKGVDMDKYFFTDEVHPTKVGHEYFANLFFEELKSKFNLLGDE